MKTRRVDEEVLYPDETTPSLAKDDIQWLIEEARDTDRGRLRICTHQDPEDDLHEMTIALTGDSYIPPHRHVGRVESMQVLEGDCHVVFFEDDGSVEEVLPMGGYGSDRRFYYRLDDPRWHSLLKGSEALVYLETTEGPFRRDDTEVAPWAPDPDDPEAVRRWKSKLREEVARRVEGPTP